MRETPSSDPAAPDAKALLRELDWMRALARRLVSDADREDLVQDVVAATLERPPRHERGLRGWLALALRNRARDLASARQARRHRESRAAQATDATASADEIEERARMQRRLVDEVLTLDAPTRRALLLRYFDGLAPAEIARREGVHASTVRSRLHRGLATLKERLGGDEHAHEWLPAVALVAAGPLGSTVELPDPPGRRADPLPASSYGAARLAAAAVLLVAGGATLFSVTDRGDPPPAVTRPLAAITAATDVDLEAPASTSRRAAARSGEVGAAAAPRTRSTEAEGDEGSSRTVAADDLAHAVLEVRVTVDGEPATSGRVLARLPGGFFDGPDDATAEGVVVAPIGVGGIATLEVPPSAHGAVAVDLGGPVLLQRRVRTTTEPRTVVTLKLGTAELDGTLLDASGSPAGDAVVQLGVRDGYDYGALSAFVTTDARGRFTIAHLPPEVFWLYAASPDDEAPERRAQGRLALGERRAILVGAGVPSVAVTGVLCDALGRPTTGVEPHGEGDLEFQMRLADGSRSIATTPLAADGTFTIALPPGAYEVVARSPGQLTGVRLSSPLRVEAGTGPVTLTLSGVRVTGQVHRADVGGPHDTSRWGPLTIELVDGDGDVRGRAGVDARGAFVLDGVAAGSYSLAVSGAELADPVTLTLGAGPAGARVDQWVR
ncbi:MAG: sigma-70 family RNA polymerase sigma factor [Planctomycetota bacterium]